MAAPGAYKWLAGGVPEDTRFSIELTGEDPKTGNAVQLPAAMPADPASFERQRNLYDKFRWEAFGKLAVGGVTVSFGLALAGGPAQAHHNDWGLPLVGGALGGYALGALVSNSKARSERVSETPATVYREPVTTYVPAVPSASTIEAQLNQLDKLAAGGYITPEEYKTRRQALLNQL